MIRGIIPACGFGTRMNMAPNKSKEMLTDPQMHSRYIIDWGIQKLWDNNVVPLVLVRPEKEDLIKHLDDLKVEYQIMAPGREWAETVWKSQNQWFEKNILLLPDTRFEPDPIPQMIQSLEFGMDLCFAVHQVEDVSKWGMVTNIIYSEKPKLDFKGNAWGLIAFTKRSGDVIFKNMQNRGNYYNLEFNTNFIFLSKFEDITRGSLK